MKIDCKHGENCPYKGEEQGPAGSRLARNTLAVVLAGGRGSRLGPLTDWRAKPACRLPESSGSSTSRCRTA